MHRLKHCKSGEYDAQAAYILSRCSWWAYLPREDAHAEYAAYGYDMQRVQVGSLSVDIATDGNQTVVAFAGTNDVADWGTSLGLGKTDWNGYQLHEGFHEAEESLFYASSDQYGPELENVWITGHSLGGALATLHALRFYDHNAGHILRGVYTYGSPRCMDNRAADMCDRMLKKKNFRHVNGNDIVPRLPSCFRFRHCGHHVRINRKSKPIQDPPPLYTLIDRVLGYRVDMVRDHFLPSYMLPLMVEAECNI